MSILPIMFQNQQSQKIIQNLPNLPRFNRQFIGIGHQLQEKKKQRKRIEQEQKALANRVLLLQKQQIKAQKKFNKKKQELNKLVQTLDRNDQHREQKQRLRQLREMQLEILKQQNKHRRLLHKEVSQSSKYDVVRAKRDDYTRIRSFIKMKQQQKREFLHEDFQSKRDQWLSMNISKEKGKHKIDQFYKKKNKQHMNHYQTLIMNEQMTKEQKLNTIKHLEFFQNALKKKLEESTMKVSKMQEKIMEKSRTIEPRKLSSSLNDKNLIKQSRKQSTSRISQIDKIFKLKDQTEIPSREQSFLSQRPNYFRNRETPLNKDNEEQIEQKIYPGNDEIEMMGFKIIRTNKKKKKNQINNRYKQYLFY